LQKEIGDPSHTGKFQLVQVNSNGKKDKRSVKKDQCEALNFMTKIHRYAWLQRNVIEGIDGLYSRLLAINKIGGGIYAIQDTFTSVDITNSQADYSNSFSIEHTVFNNDGPSISISSSTIWSVSLTHLQFDSIYINFTKDTFESSVRIDSLVGKLHFRPQGKS